MPESWDPSPIGIDRIIDRVSVVVPVDVVLAVAVGATVMVGWWMIRKLVRLAFYYGVLGAAAWLWYFGVPD